MDVLGLKWVFWFFFVWGELTYVILMVDDGVERNIFPLQVPLGWLHVVGAMVALDEAIKLTLHEGTVSQGSLLACKSEQKNIETPGTLGRVAIKPSLECGAPSHRRSPRCRCGRCRTESLLLRCPPSNLGQTSWCLSSFAS